MLSNDERAILTEFNQ